MTSSTHRDRGAVALDSLAALFIVSLLVSAFLTTIAKAAKASAGQVANTQAEILASELAGKAEAFSCAAATGTEPLFSEATSATACTAIGANLPAGDLGATIERGGDTFVARVDQNWVRPDTAAVCSDLAATNPRLVTQTITVRWPRGGGTWDPSSGLPDGYATADDLSPVTRDVVVLIPDRAPYLPASARAVVVTDPAPDSAWTVTPVGGDPITQQADADGCVWFPWLTPSDITLTGPAVSLTTDLADSSMCVTAGVAAAC